MLARVGGVLVGGVHGCAQPLHRHPRKRFLRASRKKGNSSHFHNGYDDDEEISLFINLIRSRDETHV
jgi:hypothetical protein